MTEPRVLLLGGSLADPSHTGALLRYAEQEVALRGGEPERWDVRERPLPLAEPRWLGRSTRRLDPGAALAAAAAAADALVVASPLYHSSCSGAVKNALDHLSAAELRGKPVALFSNAGSMRNPEALDHLRLIVRALLGVAIPCQLITIDDDFSLEGDAYRLRSPVAAARLEQVVQELLWFAERLAPARAPATEELVTASGAGAR